MTTHWTAKDIPDQTGRIALITGANAGLGFETARALARRGAKVVMACRRRDKALAARERIVSELPRATVEIVELDLADLASTRRCAGEVSSRYPRLDLLIANAGVMMPPPSTTEQGFELQIGVNHFGHFALTGLLLERILSTTDSRIVVLSSTAHAFGRMDFDDLDFKRRGYRRAAAYGQSKLANLLFTHGLARRLEAAGASTRVAAAHPGWTATELQRHTLAARILNPLLAMEPEQGVLPTLYAATASQARNGGYYGPHGWQQVWGYPVEVEASAAAKSREDAERLWAISVDRTGVDYARLHGASAVAHGA